MTALAAQRALPDHRSRQHDGWIGPNAVTRIAEALQAYEGEDAMRATFTAADLSRYLNAMPEHMICEREVTVLHRVLRERYGLDRARRIGNDAGCRTGDYLLTHRIPKPVQSLLRCLPSQLSSRILNRAIARHAWTFAGSGSFRIAPGAPLRFVIAGGPISRGAHSGEPVCDFYAATFQRLYRELVNPRATVVEIACEAAGAPACVFELRF